MDRITVRLPSDLIRRFDAAAAERGGRSRLLRRLVERAAQAVSPEPVQASSRRLTGKLTLRLAEADLARLVTEAAATGLSRTQWSVALIRARLHRRPQLTPVEAVALIEIRRELRRIGVNINQIAFAANTRKIKLAKGQMHALDDLRLTMPKVRTFLQAVVAEQRRRGVRLFKAFVEGGA